MKLEDRLQALLEPENANSKRMFGGTCFMLNGNMVIGTLRDGLIVRVGKDNHDQAVRRPGAKVFDMTGRPMRGYVTVNATAVAGDKRLQEWVDLALAHVKTLPPKQPGKQLKKKSQASR